MVRILFLLIFEKVYLGYQNRCIFADFSLQIGEPRVLITGPNGSGKTTLLLLAAGVLEPDDGQVCLNGQSTLDSNMKRHIGISASKVNLPGFLTAEELLDFHCKQFQCSLNDEWLTKWISAFSLTDYLTTKVDDLSLGNYKKLSLLTAICHQPDLLLLDEPANGLDEQARLALNLLISEYDGQVVIASHEALAADHNQVRHIQLQRDIGRVS